MNFLSLGHRRKNIFVLSTILNYANREFSCFCDVIMTKSDVVSVLSARILLSAPKQLWKPRYCTLPLIVRRRMQWFASCPHLHLGEQSTGLVQTQPNVHFAPRAVSRLESWFSVVVAANLGKSPSTTFPISRLWKFKFNSNQISSRYIELMAKCPLYLDPINPLLPRFIHYMQLGSLSIKLRLIAIMVILLVIEIIIIPCQRSVSITFASVSIRDLFLALDIQYIHKSSFFV